MSGLDIELLGPPRVTVDGEPLRVDTRKALAVLALLAVDGPQSRSTLAAMLWPESETARARGALRRTLSVLAKGLSNRWLVPGRTTVTLEEDGVRRDVAAAGALLAGTHDHDESGDVCAECVRELRQAVELHRGELLEDFGLRDSPAFEDWRSERAEHLRRELCHGLDRLTRAEVATGELDGALGHLERWLAVDPLNERVHGKLMLVHAWRGERSQAVARYRACVKVLDRELGVAPLPRTTQLYRAVLEDRLPPPGPSMSRIPPATPRRSDVQSVADTDTDAEWPLVGRDVELQQLLGAHGADAGRLALITGEAGIGKTRLVDELVRQLGEAGVGVATARCYPGERDLAFGPVVELLRQAVGDSRRSLVSRLPAYDLAEVCRLLPDLADAQRPLPDVSPLDSPGAQARFFEAVWDVLDATLATDTPGVVVLDDLHAADAATLELLGYGLRRLADRRLLVVLCLRLEDATDDVRRLLERRELGAVTVALGRLRSPAVADLVESVLDVDDPGPVCARLHEESEGLPLLLVEYVGLLSDGQDAGEIGDWVLPHSARDLARSRLETVSEAGRQVASAGSVIGRSFDLATVRHASGRTDEELVEALEELVGRRLVRELPSEDSRPRYDFVHDKLRAAIYEMTSLARRRLLHGRVADALIPLARRGDAGGLAAVIGEHAHLGGRDEEAAEWFAHAGDHFQALFANAEALDQYERALALGHPDTATLHARMGAVRTLTGDYAGALEELEAAAARSDGEDALAEVEHQLGALHLRRGDLPAAGAHLRAARDLARQHRPDLAGRVEADLGLLRLRQGDLAGAATHAQTAQALAEERADVESQAQALNLLGVVARHEGDIDRARYCLGRATAMADRLDDPQAHIAALNNLALATGDAGDVDAAIAILQRAVDLGAERGDRHREAALRNNLADLLHRSGRDDDAMGELKRAVAIFAEIGEAERPRPEIWKLVDW